MRFDQGSDEVEHLCRMSARRHVVERAPEAKLASEDEGRARSIFALEHAECSRQFPIFVGEQDEGESVLFRKCLMTLGRIRAHPDYHAIERFELLETVAELLGLDGAPRRI